MSPTGTECAPNFPFLMNLVPSQPLAALPHETVPARFSESRATGLVVLASLASGVLWSYWPTLERMAERWSRDPQYSHGFLVPVFAAIILTVRRGMLSNFVWQPTWWGMPLLLAGAAVRAFAASRDIESLDGLSLIPTLAGLVCLVGGWQALRWSWPALTFLAFMIPLPYQVEIALSHPLRGVATRSSTFLLQLLGFPALREGNVVLIEEVRLGVVDACSGLGMLMTFFALATAMAFIFKSPVADRVVLIISAVPIAVVANVIRISSTGMAYLWADSDTAYAIMHDLAGWLMMPLALLMLWMERWFLARLLPYRSIPRPLPVLWLNVPTMNPFPAPNSTALGS